MNTGLIPRVADARIGSRAGAILAAWAAPLLCSAQVTNLSPASMVTPALPDAGLSLVRVLAALALVLGLFLGAVWLFRNGQRLTLRGGRSPKLNVLEVRSLGGKHALYVVAYEQERLLLAASPTGVNLLSHLPAATATDIEAVPSKGREAPISFSRTLAQVLRAG